MVLSSKREKVIELFKRVLNASDIDGEKQLFPIDPEQIESVSLTSVNESELSNKQIVGMQLMLYSDLSQAKIARLLNLHRSTITKWKNENSKFQQAYWMMRIAKGVDESDSKIGTAVM